MSFRKVAHKRSQRDGIACTAEHNLRVRSMCKRGVGSDRIGFDPLVSDGFIVKRSAQRHYREQDGHKSNVAPLLRSPFALLRDSNDPIEYVNQELLNVAFQRIARGCIRHITCTCLRPNSSSLPEP